MIESSFPEYQVDADVAFSARLRSPGSTTESDYVNIEPHLWEYLHFQMTALRFDCPLSPSATAAPSITTPSAEVNGQKAWRLATEVG